MKQVYDTSLVADQIEGVPLMTLLDPANHERFSLYAGALWDNPPPDDPTRTLVGGLRTGIPSGQGNATTC